MAARSTRAFGYTEGRNIAFEYHSTEGNFDQMREEARKLASIPVDTIVAYGSTGTRAARQATTTIPIVTIGVGDPVRAGFVTLARPGGNVTGNSNVGPELTGKRLEILKDLVPDVTRVAFAFNPDNDSNLAFLEELIIAVPALGLQLISVPIRASDDFDGAFAAMMHRQPNALVTTNDDLYLQHMEQIIDFTVRHHLPAMYQAKENVRAGGLIAYGATLSELFGRGAWYVNKVFRRRGRTTFPVRYWRQGSSNQSGKYPAADGGENPIRSSGGCARQRQLMAHRVRSLRRSKWSEG
jgi:putative tryptophan/tyrosine transport system substrate-binding protein